MSDIFLLILIVLVGYMVYMYLQHKDTINRWFEGAVHVVEKYTPVGWLAYFAGWLSSPSIESPVPGHEDKKLQDEIKQKIGEYEKQGASRTPPDAPTPNFSLDQLPLLNNLYSKQQDEQKSQGKITIEGRQ